MTNAQLKIHLRKVARMKREKRNKIIKREIKSIRWSEIFTFLLLVVYLLVAKAFAITVQIESMDLGIQFLFCLAVPFLVTFVRCGALAIPRTLFDFRRLERTKGLRISKQRKAR